jgi:hypothetical protein
MHIQPRQKVFKLKNTLAYFGVLYNFIGISLPIRINSSLL